ncbi:MAG: bifunctional diaminohydroxyphosphoribosylaminopyrimidine deaminase/5-amino-6-(5-phosphoribosylamino)uracil reductase RibD [Gemmataceae bacterium]
MGNDWTYMQRALELAELGRGGAEPNPLVGAVIVNNDKVVGEGHHERYGGPHAEVNALAMAGEAARGGTLFVTLEPCCHHGKTPPCTTAVTRAGIRRVVAAMGDPFPKVAGNGARLLREAGIPIEFGLGEAESRKLNAPYLKLLATARPYVHAKWAMTLDGKIATRTGHSQWISNETSRRRVHALRARVDGILVGIGTALADDPMLNARLPESQMPPRIATRIVLDSRCRLPTTSRLVQTASEYPTLVVVDKPNDPSHVDALRDHLCEVVFLSKESPKLTGHEEQLGRGGIEGLLDLLGRRRMTNLLVEGGADVLGRFVDADAIDEFHVFVAPLVAGGDGKSPVGGLGVEKMSEALRMETWNFHDTDGDVYCHGRRKAEG